MGEHCRILPEMSVEIYQQNDSATFRVRQLLHDLALDPSICRPFPRFRLSGPSRTFLRREVLSDNDGEDCVDPGERCILSC